MICGRASLLHQRLIASFSSSSSYGIAARRRIVVGLGLALLALCLASLSLSATQHRSLTRKREEESVLHRDESVATEEEFMHESTVTTTSTDDDDVLAAYEEDEVETTTTTSSSNDDGEEDEKPQSRPILPTTYLPLDVSRYVAPAFANTKTVTLDVNFHHYDDVHGMIALNFTNEEIEEVLLDISRTWARGNIRLRFKTSDARQREWIDDARADAYRWWVLAFKNFERNETRAKADVRTFLREGASRMSAEDADRVVRRYFEHRGHSLLNWILGIGANRQRHRAVVDIDIYSHRFHAWYNGGSDGWGRIFARGGSCTTRFVPRSVPRGRVLCLNWDKEHQREEFSALELARIAAHEIGHQLGLPHPAGGECVASRTVEQLRLMAQQRSVTVVGTPCAEQNPYAKRARFLDANELEVARKSAVAIAQRQRIARERRKAGGSSTTAATTTKKTKTIATREDRDVDAR